MHINLSTVLLICLICFAGTAVSGSSWSEDGPSGEGLVITVKKSDKATEFSGSSWYLADFFNGSSKVQVLEAVQMPGGYAGSGKFFACGLEAWSARRHSWFSLWPAKISGYGRNPNLTNVEVRQKDHLRVCGRLLPAQAGSVGQCVRFTLRLRWRDHSSPVLTSKPFTIGEQPSSSDPCSRRVAHPFVSSPKSDSKGGRVAWCPRFAPPSNVRPNDAQTLGR